MTFKELRKLRNSMPKGYSQQLADKFNKTVSYIHMIMRGTRQNNAILMEAIRMAKEEAERKVRLREEIKAL